MTPLVAPEVDLRDFPYMPLDVVRLRDSDLSALSSGEGFRAAVMLWCACWHQIPAASLPDDDRVLSNLAGFGRAVSEWLKIKSEALRGFELCDDGRLYHKLIAEKANDAWEAKKRRRARTEAARAAKLQQNTPADCDNERASSVTEKTTPVTEDQATLLQAGLERERERESDRDSLSSSLRSDECAGADAPPAEQKKRKVRKKLEETQLNDDSQPDKAQCDLAAAAGLDDSAFRFHWRAFRSWHVTRGEWRKDWVQSWAKWIGRIPASQKIMAPRDGPSTRPDPQEIRNPALRALQRLSQKNEQIPDEPDIFSPGSGACQRTIEGRSSAPETGFATGGNGPVLALAAFRRSS